MIKTWEKMAISTVKSLKEIPEDINDMVHKIRSVCPALFEKLGLLTDPSIKHESFVAVHRFGTWGSYGMPVFNVTPDLFASLLLTDPQNVLAEDIKFPYRTFLIRVPDGFWKIESFIDEKFIKVPWIWVHEYNLTNREYKNATWWRLDAASEDGTCITCYDEKPRSSLKEFLSAEDLINSPLYIKTNPHERGISLSMRRLAINLCLYLSEVGNIKKKKSYKNRGKSKRKKDPEPTVWVVGSGIKISKDLIEASKDWTKAKQGDKEQWTIKKRFTVRGHWRNQAYGEKRKLRKKIWIAPHWKGPGKGEKLPRVYDVRR